MREHGVGAMAVGIIIANVLLVALLISVAWVIRDIRRLHHSGRSLTDRPVDAAGVSSAGMVAIGNNVTH
jgi:hypothetical protein